MKQAGGGEESAGGEQLPPLGSVFEFLRLIWAVEQGVNAVSRRMEAELGITAQERLVLRIVGRMPGIPAGMLAGFLGLHPGALTGALQRLDRAGLLDRRLDPRDRRRVLLGLTARGRRFDAPAPGTVEAAVERTLSGLPRLKLDAARDVLQVLVQALEESRRQERPRGRRGRKPGAPGRLSRQGPPEEAMDASLIAPRPQKGPPAAPGKAPRGQGTPSLN